LSAPRILSTPGREAYAYPLLIRHLLGHVADQTKQEIVSGDLRFDYRQFVDRVTRLAGLLHACGVRAGDTVAVMDWDSHRYLECYFAVPMMGAVLQTVNVRLSPDQMAFTLEQSQASFLLYNGDFVPLCADLLPRLGAMRGTLHMDDYEVAIAATPADYLFVDFDENAVATTFHTTGTTGDPKQVFFTHRQLVLHTLALSSALANQPDGQGMQRSDVYMPMTPMFHVHAWGMPYVATMLGAKQVYPGRYEAATLLALKRREGVTLSHCVPTILRMLLDAEEADAETLAPWKVVVGGASLPEALAQEAARAGITTIVGYGMSETGPVISLARGDGEDSAAMCRAGFAIPLAQARIDADNGGELVLRAPWLTQGHATQAASDALWTGGWLHTGDVAEVDEDGAIRIVDRLKDVIKTGGEWISSTEVENLLVAQPDVSEAAVIGVPDRKWGERPVAFVVAAGGFDPEQACACLKGHIAAGRLSRYALPERFVTLASLPRTSVGKIDKKALRAMVQEA
jgi:fatty-acyl-CoA synthase